MLVTQCMYPLSAEGYPSGSQGWFQFACNTTTYAALLLCLGDLNLAHMTCYTVLIKMFLSQYS